MHWRNCGKDKKVLEDKDGIESTPAPCCALSLRLAALASVKERSKETSLEAGVSVNEPDTIMRTELNI